MGKEPVENVPVVTRFVREVLGCNCADQVFRHIEVQHGSSAVKACSTDCELRIGGRLLIVVTSEPMARLSSHLAEAIVEGKRARDESGFNRFRLVVQTENAAKEKDTLLHVFETSAEKDERTHLHVLSKAQAPEFFSHAPHAD